MEAKVDIRKLQLLNDRINQTIEALNQVRYSVHGLSHTGGMGFGQGIPGQIPNVGLGYGVASQGMGFGGVPFGAQPFGQQLGGVPFGGMSHTGGIPPQAWGYNPYLAQAFGVNPFVQGLQGQGYMGQVGLSHTSPEIAQDPRQMVAGWLLQQQMDPYYGTRVAQTFPFAQWPLSPVG